MIKVLVLVHNLRAANGVASFVINYYRKINHQDVQMDFAIYEKLPSPYYSEIEEAGNKVYVLPKVKNIFEHLKMCRKILRENSYDVIHDNALHNSLPMMWCAKSYGVPVRILHSHNSKLGETAKKEARNKLFLPILRAFATDYTACSQLAGQAMFGAHKYIVIPNAINVKKYYFNDNTRSEIRKKMDADSKLVVGTVGRLAGQKNPYFAMDVFKQMLENVPNAEYWWIGNGPLDQQIKNYVEEQGISNRVKLFGSRNDVIDLYQAMDCFFLPSLFEGLPVTGIEAQAMGLPMVVSDTVTGEMAYTDLVDYVNLNESIETWAKHLEKALHWKGDRNIYEKQLRESCFADTDCGERLLEIYKQMIQEK